MPGLGVHRGDHPLRGHPARDPPPPIAPVGALGRFHVLPGHQRQQRHRGRGGLVELGVGERRDHRVGVGDQRRDQDLLGLRVGPVDPRLTGLGVIVPGAPGRDHLARPGNLPGHPPDRRDQLGNGVLGGHRVIKDRGIHRPAPPPGQHPGRLDHLPDRVVDPMRALGLGDPPPPVHQARRVEPLIEQRQPARHLPPQITAHRLGALPIRQPVQRLQRQNRRHPGRRQRRTTNRGEQIRVGLVGEHLTTVRGQEREHAARRDQVPDHLAGVPQLPIRPLHALHPKIIPAPGPGTLADTPPVQPGFSAPS